jgi:hypothetical protein
LRFAALAVLLVSLALPAGATSFVMMRDEDLAAGAEAIVIARVVSVEERSASSRARTRTLVAVEEVLQGSVPENEIVVQTPGGVSDRGLKARIQGVPRFESGDRAILFLDRNTDGSFSPHQLFLGVFLQRSGTAVRDAQGAAEIRVASAPAQSGVRDFARFASWLRARAGGGSGAPDYWRQDSRLSSVSAEHRFFEYGGHRIRWFEFQRDTPVQWVVADQPGTTLDDANVENLIRALAAWNGDEGSEIRYEYAGRSAEALGGLTEPDDFNAILFDDPHNDASGTFGCTNGGVIAVGGPWFDETDVRTYRGVPAIRTAVADVVFNKGVQCLNAKAMEEVLAHELGHTLGFGHSCGDAAAGTCVGNATAAEALMRATVHDDGRGADLRGDDRAAAAAHYGVEGPVVNWTASASPVRPGVPVTFSLSREQQGASYEWSFGDGTTATTASPSHTFAVAGTYEVTLRATDATGTNVITQFVDVTPMQSRRRAVRH